MTEPGEFELRRVTNTDFDFLLALDNDAEVMKFINGGEPVDADTYRETVWPTMSQKAADPFGFWLIDTARGSAGWVSLRENGLTVAEIGYRLARPFWGAGLATRASRVLLDRCFAAGLHRVQATTYEHNTASIRVMKRLGMQLTKTFKWSPAEHQSDTAVAAQMPVWDGVDVVYELARETWLARQS